MHDSGGADTGGGAMLITSAVAIVFSCSEGNTYSLRVPCSIGRDTWALVCNKMLQRFWQSIPNGHQRIRLTQVESSTTIGRDEKQPASSKIISPAPRIVGVEGAIFIKKPSPTPSRVPTPATVGNVLQSADNPAAGGRILAFREGFRPLMSLQAISLYSPGQSHKMERLRVCPFLKESLVLCPVQV